MGDWRDGVARAAESTARALGKIHDVTLIQRSGAVNAVTGEPDETEQTVAVAIDDSPELTVSPGGDEPARDAIVTRYNRDPVIRVGDSFVWGERERRVVRVTGDLVNIETGRRIQYRCEVV